MDFFNNFSGFSQEPEKEKHETDWQDFEKALKLIKKFCKQKAGEIDGIIAVPNTGLILAAMLAKELDKEIFVEPQEGKFLVVDLVADNIFNDFIKEGNISVGMYAISSQKKPDYFVYNIPENTEVKFPWDK